MMAKVWRVTFGRVCWQARVLIVLLAIAWMFEILRAVS